MSINTLLLILYLGHIVCGLCFYKKIIDLFIKKSKRLIWEDFILGPIACVGLGYFSFIMYFSLKGIFED